VPMVLRISGRVGYRRFKEGESSYIYCMGTLLLLEGKETA
jgi:hypothetical protein